MDIEGIDGKNKQFQDIQSGKTDGIQSELMLADLEFPLGYFIISPMDEQVRMNRRMGDILALEEPLTEPLSVTDFWQRIVMASSDPDQARKKIDLILENINQHPVLDLEWNQSQSRLSILMYPTVTESQPPAGYAGIVIDLSFLQGSFIIQAGMLQDLTLQIRKSSASIQGKLGALLENLEVWPRLIQQDFLQEMQTQLGKMNKALDLSLNLSGLMDSLNVFAERIDLALLIENMISDLDNPDILFISQIKEGDTALFAQVDPALTQLGLSYLIEEIQENSLPGKLKISLSRENGLIVLQLESPRTLALPGMSPLAEEPMADEGSVRMYLAQRLFAALGSSIKIVKSSDQAEEVYRILIHFQEKETPEINIRELQKAEPVAIDQGRILLAISHADQQIRLKDIYEESGYRVDLAVDGSTTLDLAQRNNPDLVIVSRSLPGLDGLLVTQGIRRWSAMPIIMISERTNPDDLNYAYQLGVDDYLRVPLAREELLARARVCIRRSVAAKQVISPDIYQSNLLKIDYSMQKVWIRGEIIELTPIEYNLLVYMSRHGNQIIPYQQLLENVWEGPEKGTRQGLFVHIKRLREKIELNPKDPQFVTNKWGVGYVFTD